MSFFVYLLFIFGSSIYGMDLKEAPHSLYGALHQFSSGTYYAKNLFSLKTMNKINYLPSDVLPSKLAFFSAINGIPKLKEIFDTFITDGSFIRPELRPRSFEVFNGSVVVPKDLIQAFQEKTGSSLIIVLNRLADILSKDLELVKEFEKMCERIRTLRNEFAVSARKLSKDPELVKEFEEVSENRAVQELKKLPELQEVYEEAFAIISELRAETAGVSKTYR